MKRILYLDGVPEDCRLSKPIIVSKVVDLSEVYDLMFRRKAIPVTLDIRPLSRKHSGRLLKFIEEYRGDITMIASDPVYPAILSRFNETVKVCKFSKTSWTRVKLQNARGSVADKVRQLMGVSDDRSVG